MTALQGWLVVAGVMLVPVLLAAHLFGSELARLGRVIVRRWRRARVGRWLSYQRRLRQAEQLVHQLRDRSDLLASDREALSEPLEFADVGTQLARSLATATQGMRELGTSMALERARRDLDSLRSHPVKLWRR